MKHILLFFLFSGSLDSFCQVRSVQDLVEDFKKGKSFAATLGSDTSKKTMFLVGGKLIYHSNEHTSELNIAPDTMRAIILVTLSAERFNLSNAHARVGYVVLQAGKEPMYLDCRKTPLKLPQVGWGYKILGGEK